MKTIEVTQHVNPIDFMAGIQCAIDTLTCANISWALKCHANKEGMLDVKNMEYSDSEDVMDTLSSWIMQEAVRQLYNGVDK